MRIDPQIAALRGDPAAQRCMQAALTAAHADWSAAASLEPVMREFARYAAGEGLASLRQLRALVEDHVTASAFIESFCDKHVAALEAHPLAQMPVRHSHSGGFSTIQLMAEHGASLSLAVYEPVAMHSPPQSAIFADREQHEIVVAGAGDALFCEDGGAGEGIKTSSVALQPGDAFHFDCASTMRHIVSVAGRLVLLQLSRTPERPLATREKRISDGALLMQSDGDKRTSQAAMAIAVLGALERADAVPVMEQLAFEGPDHLRWEAVRHMLTLDALAGLAALDRMSGAKDDALREPACQLAGQLRQIYPALSLEEAA